MCLVQRVRDLDGDLQGLIEWQRTLRQPVLKTLAFQVLHDQEVGAFVRVELMERADVRVVQRGNGLGLALEAFAAVGIRRVRQGGP